MSNKPEDIIKHASISTLVNSLFRAGLAIASLLVVIMSIAGVLHQLSWNVLSHVLAQILLGLVMCSAVILFVHPRMQLILKKTNSTTKFMNIFLTVFGVAFIAFLITLLSTLWPSPEMNFLEKTLSNLGFISGVAISSRMYLIRDNLH